MNAIRTLVLALVVFTITLATITSEAEAQAHSFEAWEFLQKNCTSGEQVPTPPEVPGWCFAWNCSGVEVISCHIGFNPPHVVIVGTEVLPLF